MVEEMTEAQAQQWVHRVLAKDAPVTLRGPLKGPVRTSDNPALLRLFTAWREADSKVAGASQEVNSSDATPVRLRNSLREMGLSEDGWD